MYPFSIDTQPIGRRRRSVSLVTEIGRSRLQRMGWIEISWYPLQRGMIPSVPVMQNVWGGAFHSL